MLVVTGMTKTSEILTKARDLIADARWIQGDMTYTILDDDLKSGYYLPDQGAVVAPKDTKPGACFCAVGAVRYALNGVAHTLPKSKRSKGYVPTKQYADAITTLASALTPAQRRKSDHYTDLDDWESSESSVINANDSRHTRRNHIVALFDRAIAIAEKVA